MKQQVGIAYLVHAAVTEETTHMFLQLLTVLERVLDTADQVFLLDRQGIRVFRVDGRPVLIFQLELFSI